MSQKNSDFYLMNILPLRSFQEMSAMVHAATSNKTDLNSLMIFEGSKYRELVEILGTQLGPTKQE